MMMMMIIILIKGTGFSLILLFHLKIPPKCTFGEPYLLARRPLSCWARWSLDIPPSASSQSCRDADTHKLSKPKPVLRIHTILCQIHTASEASLTARVSTLSHNAQVAALVVFTSVYFYSGIQKLPEVVYKTTAIDLKHCTLHKESFDKRFVWIPLKNIRNWLSIHYANISWT